MLSRLSFSNVIAIIALFVALGGSSYAAITLPKNSVGPKQIEKNAVRSVEVKPRSLLKSDLKKSAIQSLQGAQGPQGPQGLQGPQGAPGAPGATKVIARDSAFTVIAPDTNDNAQVDCLPGETATGGGIETTNGHTGDMMAGVSRPVSGADDKPTGWYVRAFNIDRNEDDMGNISVRAYVVCASP
jgi:hypothetical protein